MDKRISIITVSFNSVETISQTIESVINQSYPNIEYIIIDGNSTDGTQLIVESFGNKITKFISEKDSGLYEAMNKGIDLATGEVVGILNSDDFYASNEIIKLVMDTFLVEKSDCIFGDLIYFQSKNPNKTVRKFSGRNFKRSKVKIGILPPHPTFFVKREIYERHGRFDTQFKYASDFDLMARFLFVNKISYHYLPQILVKMRLGGISTGSLNRIIKINKEDLASCKKNNIPTNFMIFHFKYLIKIFQVNNIFDLIVSK